VVARTAQLLSSHRAQHEVRLEAGRVPEVRTDPELLKQVFINLGINALQAMQQPGTLTIGTEVVEDQGPRSFGAAAAPRRRVRVRFADTGVGIAEDEISRIFMPFYTTKEKGTGLGLAICDRIVRNLGGSIEVQSRSGMGTTFSVLLPMDDAS
jgi:signal transduction histidine kinase